MLNRRRFVGLAAAAIAAPSILAARAAGADWPARPVRIVVPFTPGGSTDITARLVGNRLQEVWGQTVVIENKPGAGGNIAADMVAHSDPDGYTIFIVGPGMATNQFLYPSLSYDPVGDFAPVTLLITQPNMMCVPNTSTGEIGEGVHRLLQRQQGQGDLRLVRQRHHAASERRAVQAAGQCRDDAHPLSRRRAGDQRSHSRPRRRHPSTTCRRSSPHVEGGAVRALAVTTKERVAVVPDMPTIAETACPASTCSRLVRLLRAGEDAAGDHRQTQRRHQRRAGHAAVKSRFDELGATPKGSTPGQLAAFLQSEIDKWGPVIKEAKIRVEN